MLAQTYTANTFTECWSWLCLQEAAYEYAQSRQELDLAQRDEKEVQLKLAQIQQALDKAQQAQAQAAQDLAEAQQREVAAGPALARIQQSGKAYYDYFVQFLERMQAMAAYYEPKARSPSPLVTPQGLIADLLKPNGLSANRHTLQFIDTRKVLM